MKFRGIINETFLDEIRLSTIKTSYNFEKDKQIPDALKHENLLVNLTPSCKDYYFLHTKDLITDTEYRNFKKVGYIGKKEYFLLPYNDVYNGAYLSRTQLILTFSHIAFGDKLYYNDIEILKYPDIFPFFDEYRLGFFKGFETFEDTFILQKSSIFNSDESKLNLIFEYATNSWKMQQSFSTSRLHSDKTNLVDGFESGLEVGYKYKSWSLILANSKLFENLFIEKKNLQNIEITTTNKTFTPQPYLQPENSIEFFNKVNQNVVSELDILNFIERATNDEKHKLEILAKDIETFEIDFTSKVIVESYFGVHNAKSVSELFTRFKELVFNKINKRPQQINYLSKSLSTIFIDTTSNEKFNSYLKLHIVEPYIDYSYLFQRMLNENIIVKTKHLDFINWLFDNQYITENIKDLFIEKGGFRSLRKSYSTQRENNFNNVFNL